MIRSLGCLITALAGLLFLATVQAQETPKKTALDADAIFKKLDTNNDGILSKEEFLKLCDRYKDKGKAREKLTLAYEKIDPQAQGISRVTFRKYIEYVETARKKDSKN